MKSIKRIVAAALCAVLCLSMTAFASGGGYVSTFKFEDKNSTGIYNYADGIQERLRFAGYRYELASTGSYIEGTVYHDEPVNEKEFETLIKKGTGLVFYDCDGNTILDPEDYIIANIYSGTTENGKVYFLVVDLYEEGAKDYAQALARIINLPEGKNYIQTKVNGQNYYRYTVKKGLSETTIVLGDGTDTYEEITMLANCVKPSGSGVPGTFTMEANMECPANISNWAFTAVKAADEMKITNPSKNYSYREAITREDFCELAMNTLKHFGVKENGAASDPFSDTDDPNVIALYNLGIINGKTATTFAPHDRITRQEAAKILSGMSDAVSLSLFGEVIRSSGGPNSLTFTDEAEFGDWAVEHIYNVSRFGIMRGVGERVFDPDGTYTTEQAILTMVRLFDIFPME